MEELKVKLQTYLQRVNIDKRVALMVPLLATAMLLWGRLLLKDAPRVATAVPQSGQLSEFDELQSTVNASSPDQSKVIELEFEPHTSRNLFDWDPSRYNRTSDSLSHQDNPKLNQFTADDQERVAEAKALAEELQFQSVVQGERRQAFINGRLVKDGDQIQGFTVRTVHERAVELEINGVVIRLNL